MQIFFDLNIPRNLPLTIFVMFARYPLSILWQNHLHWQKLYKFWEKTHLFSQQPDCGTFWKILVFQSGSTDKKIQNQNRTLASCRTLSISENVKNFEIPCFVWTFFLPKLNLGGKKRSLSESKNQDGKHSNVGPTMRKTKRISERRGLPNFH